MHGGWARPPAAAPSRQLSQQSLSLAVVAAVVVVQGMSFSYVYIYLCVISWNRIDGLVAMISLPSEIGMRQRTHKLYNEFNVC